MGLPEAKWKEKQVEEEQQNHLGQDPTNDSKVHFLNEVHFHKLNQQIARLGVIQEIYQFFR
jgi:hypothetical protein